MDHIEFADSLAKRGAKAEALLFSSLHLLHELDTLGILCSVTPLSPGDERRDAIAFALSDVVEAHRHAEPFYTSGLRDDFRLATRETATVGGVHGQTYVEATLMLAERTLRYAGLAINDSIDWQSWPFTDENAADKCDGVVRMVCTALEGFDHSKAAIDVTKEFQRVENRLPMFDGAPPWKGHDPQKTKVMRMIRDGKSNGEISEGLPGIDVDTIRQWRSRYFKKWAAGVKS